MSAVFDSTLLLDFDNPAPNFYRFAFLQTSPGLFKQGGTDVTIPTGAIIGGNVFFDPGGFTSEVKTWVAVVPTPQASAGGLVLLIFLGGAGQVYRRWAHARLSLTVV